MIDEQLQITEKNASIIWGSVGKAQKSPDRTMCEFDLKYSFQGVYQISLKRCFFVVVGTKTK